MENLFFQNNKRNYLKMSRTKIIKIKSFQNIFEKKSKKIRKKTNEKQKEKIIIDYREKNSFVPTELMKKDLDLEFKPLKVADYIINSVAIERKTTSDFISSIINKRIFKQLEELKQYPNPLLIIEGNPKNLEDSGINPNAIKGFLLSITLKFKIPIILTKDAKETAQYLFILSQKKEKEFSLNPKKRNLTKNQQLQYIIESFPNIGPKKAKKLLEKFETIQETINPNKDSENLKDLKQILGKRADDFLELIKRQYKKEE